MVDSSLDDADVVSEIDHLRRSRQVAKAIRDPAQKRTGPSHNVGDVIAAGQAIVPFLWPLGLALLILFPFPQYTKIYQSNVVETQIEERIAAKEPIGFANFSLADIDPFPDTVGGVTPYDVAVSVEDKDFFARAVIDGAFGYHDGGIIIPYPTRIALDQASAKGAPTADLVKRNVPSALRSGGALSFLGAVVNPLVNMGASQIGGQIDHGRAQSAGANAQTAARDVVIFRVPDQDRALFESGAVEAIFRTPSGLTVNHTKGFTVLHALFWAMFLGGGAGHFLQRM